MSLFSTIAHDGMAPARRFSPKGMRMVAVGLALGVVIGFTVSSRTAEQSSGMATAAPAGSSHEDFLRLNTTALEGLSLPGPIDTPGVQVAPAAVTKPQSAVDRFINLNTTLEGLSLPGPIDTPGVQVVPAAVTKPQSAVDRFIYLNTTALDYLPDRYLEPSRGPR